MRVSQDNTTECILPRLSACLPWILLATTSCGPGGSSSLGIVWPDSFEARYLKLRNESAGYVVYRVRVPGYPDLTTPALPPGGDSFCELKAAYGTLCPASIRVELFAYARAHPERSPLDDETLVSTPFASVGVDLLPGRDFGCLADVDYVTLNQEIDCVVHEVDEPSSAIGFQAAWVAPRRQIGPAVDNPPAPMSPPSFPLRGRVVNQQAQPMANVEIRLGDLGVSVFTDAAGWFSVSRPAGNYLLEAIVPGASVSPFARRFTHRSEDEIPIEWIALAGGTP